MKREMNPIELPQFLKECENIFFLSLVLLLSVFSKILHVFFYWFKNTPLLFYLMKNNFTMSISIEI